MQLRALFSALFILSLFSLLFSQESKEPIEVDFLIDYYQQDGDNSAVTGGKGTEKLHNVAPVFIVTIPLNQTDQLIFNGGIDAYSSASSDNIDPIRSGASYSDVRGHFDVTYNLSDPEQGLNWGYNGGASLEFDYYSFSVGGHWAKTFANGNSEINLSGHAYIDNLKLIYPIEVRKIYSQKGKNTDGRQTFDFSLTYSQVLSRKAQIALTAQMVHQSGYLSTPFNRVYFKDEQLPRIEKLPDTRFKLPVGLRFNYYLSDLIVTRLTYRYYNDDFGISAHTAGIEIPVRFSSAFAVSPFFRYHDQTATDYFQPFGEHVDGTDFYTSDYDLSALNSQKYGVDIRYYPVFGITRLFNSFSLKRMDLRLAQYYRSDGLSAFTVNLGFSFLLD